MGEMSGHLHKEFKRAQIPRLYGCRYNPGKWNVGHVSLPGRILLFATLDKSRDMGQAAQYVDRLLSPTVLLWSSQANTSADSKRGRELLGAAGALDVHVWLRHRKRSGKFVYCGLASMVEYTGERPIAITWRLHEAIPPEICARLAGAG